MKFSFGDLEHKSLEVDILAYERAPVGEYYDDNWLTSQIRVRAGGFRGQIDAAILTSELAGFLAQLRLLCETLSGKAEFSTLEEQLQLTLTGDGKGHIHLTGHVADQPGIGNRLLFTLNFDQTQLAESMRQLHGITEAFPVRSE
jgi:hypothetical protein